MDFRRHNAEHGTTLGGFSKLQDKSLYTVVTMLVSTYICTLSCEAQAYSPSLVEQLVSGNAWSECATER